MSININDLNNIFNNASTNGILNKDTSFLICNNLNDTVLMGCNGLAVDDIQSTEVTLVTALFDVSSSIYATNLTDAVIAGQNEMLKAFKGAKKKDEIMIAQWLFNDSPTVIHSYIPVKQATELDKKNYKPSGGTALYDVLLSAMASNFAYADLLRNTGTPVKNIIIVITDGEDTTSKKSAQNVKKLSTDLLKTEQYVLAYAGVGNDNHKAIAESIGFPSVIVTGANASDIRNVFRMVSESVIKVSQTNINPNNKNSFFVI